MKNRAFTLIEVIATMSLLIVIATFTTMSTGYEKVMIDTELDRLVADIHYIKTLNIKGNPYAMIELDSYNNSYIIHTATDSDEVKLKNIKINSYTNSKISFNDNGWTTGDTITIKTKLGSYRISVTAITGVVRVKKL